MNREGNNNQSDADPDFDPEFEKLKNSKFKQQKLPAWRPVPTITSTTLTFIIFGIIFIVIGIIVLIYSNKVIEYKIQYDNLDQCKLSGNLPKQCSVGITINDTMTAPVMVYYQLNGFYQNHRRYVKSKSNPQLEGQNVPISQLNTDCDPIVTNADLGKTIAMDGKTPLDPNAPANPCGLIAKSLFNDTFSMTFVGSDSTETPVLIDEKGIAWDADIRMKYKAPANQAQIAWTDVTNEHFMVWMRPAGLPNFRKLYGRIQKDLQIGNYNIIINNQYPVESFNGEKYIVLSTVNAFGGKNSFLGISYIVVGCICFVMALLFFLGYKAHNSRKKET